MAFFFKLKIGVENKLKGNHLGLGFSQSFHPINVLLQPKTEVNITVTKDNMKKLLIALSLFLAVPFAQAETMIVGAEIPLSYTFATADDGGNLEADGAPSGIIGYVGLPIIGTFGFESYEIALTTADSSKIKTQMFDYMYTFLLPFLDISLGVGGGIGQTQVTGDLSSSYSTATSSQYFFKLGIPVFGPVQLRYTLSNVNAQIERTDGAFLEAGGVMSAFGVAMGF